jgi:hypothetical protein
MRSVMDDLVLTSRPSSIAEAFSLIRDRVCLRMLSAQAPCSRVMKRYLRLRAAARDLLRWVASSGRKAPVYAHNALNLLVMLLDLHLRIGPLIARCFHIPAKNVKLCWT